MAEPPGDLPNAHPIAMRNSDPTIVFHRQHPFFSVKLGLFKSPQPTESAAVGPFSMPIFTPRGGSLLRADFHPLKEGRNDDAAKLSHVHLLVLQHQYGLGRFLTTRLSAPPAVHQPSIVNPKASPGFHTYRSGVRTI
jgi:hypothetical protein